MACPGGIFSRAIVDEMMNCAHQSSSTESICYWDGLRMNLTCSDDREVPNRFKRTAVQKPAASRAAMINVSAPIFRGNRFQVGGSKK